jgi:hypothetical protein
MTDPRVTVVPFTSAGLQSVTTPYVSFEHELEDRPGRFVRQADIMDLVGMRRCWSLGEVWPMQLHRPRRTQVAATAIRGLAAGKAQFNSPMWPETGIYRTAVVRRLKPPTTVRYRPALLAWCMLYDYIGREKMMERGVLTTDTLITAPSRRVYPFDPTVPTPTMPTVTKPLSVIIPLCGETRTLTQTIASLRAQTFQDFEVVVVGREGDPCWVLLELDGLQVTPLVGAATATEGELLNLALSGVEGERLCIWHPSTVSDSVRFERQLAMDVELSGSFFSVRDGQRLTPQPHAQMLYGFTAPTMQPFVHTPTLMWHRDVTTRVGGFAAHLSVRAGDEFLLRATRDYGTSIGRLQEELVQRLRIGGEDMRCEQTHYTRYYWHLVGRDIAAYHRYEEGAPDAWTDA